MSLLYPKTGKSTPFVVRSKSGKSRGFALLITITLLAFLVLLLVSLASLTRVETQVASNTQALSLARQNALLGLNIALGQLQKYTGPDQRVTARAEILDADPLDRDTSGQPIIDSAALPHRYWTGAWDSSKWKPLTGEYDGYGISGIRGRKRPDAMVWLVSGNETQGDKFKPTGALAAPSEKQTLFSGVTAAGAVDKTNPRVEVPTVEIKSSSVAGMTGDQTVGHYAYWVGDEGVKAKINSLAPPAVADATSSGSGPASANYYWKAMSPTRSGAELIMTGTSRAFPNFKEAAALTGEGESLRENLRKTVLSQQLSFLGNVSGAPILPDIGMRQHSFDVTTVSKGVLSDTVRGGLRLDLTRYLQTGSTDGAFVATDSIYKDASDAGIVKGGRQPSFSLLKSWYDIGKGLSGGMTPSASIQPEMTSGNTITAMGLFPVITRFHLMFSAMGGLGQPLKVLIHPSVTLWNPHNVALDADDMVVEIEKGYTINVAVEARRDDGEKIATPKRYLTGKGKYGAEDLLPRLGGTSSTGAGGAVRLLMKGVRLEPGEAVVYTLDMPPAVVWPAATDKNVVNFPQMVPRRNTGNYLEVTMGAPLTLASSPALVGEGDAKESLQFVMAVGSAGNYRFKARLYKSSLYPNGLLQNLENPSAQGAGSFSTGDPFGGTTVVDPVTGKESTTPLPDGSSGPFPLLPTPPHDSNPFLGETATMSMAFSDTRILSQFNGTTHFVPSIPFAQFNLRGAFGVLTSFEWPRGGLEADPFFGWAKVGGGIPTIAAEPDNDKDLAYAGAAPVKLPGSQGNYAIMFDYPRRETAPASNSAYPSMVSLGEFQHADLSSFMLQPTYVFGNSWPDPRINRDNLAGRITQNPAADAEQIVNAVNDVYLRDASYLANHALWDRFFLSTIPQAGAIGLLDSEFPLANTRMRPIPDMISGTAGFPSLSDVRDVKKAAGSLLLDGAFNINSTSVDAWRVFLGGLADVPVPDTGWNQSGIPAGGTPPATLRHNYSRFLLPRSHLFDSTAFSATTTTGSQKAGAWTGYRHLTDAEIDTLARNLVEEVKVRGPFMSIADFVNRRLITASADEAMTTTNDITKHRRKVGASGAIQKAILNLTDITQGLNAALNEPVMGSASFTYGGKTAQAYDISGSSGFRGLSGLPSQLELMNGGLVGQLSYGAPGFLTQADVLQKIGGGISARSDTFVIRTYGDVLNPATGATEGRAWCEAVVQRFPEYTAASAAQPPDAGSSAAGSPALNSTNETFGRRYKVVSFRWLTDTDI